MNHIVTLLVGNSGSEAEEISSADVGKMDKAAPFLAEQALLMGANAERKGAERTKKQFV
jgi:hypothetical protein